MREIILNADVEGAVTFDVADLANYLERIEDPRSEIGRIYPLPMLLIMIILAKLAGQDKPWPMVSWVRERKDELKRLFGWERDQMPCLNTFRTIMEEVVSAQRLEEVFVSYLHERYGGQESELIAIDGKTLRGTIPKGMTRGLHLLAVYLPEEGVTLKQVVVDEKKNEISASRGLLDDISLKRRIVCADAMHTHRKLSVEITARGGNYVWFVKGNQEKLLADVQRFFEPVRHSAGWHIPALPVQVAQTSNKSHGRLEKRILTLMVDKDDYLDWPALAQLFKLERHVTHIKSGKQTTEVVYGITSCKPENVDAQRLLDLIRNYWGIENGLHYRRDVTLREDYTRFSSHTMATFMACCNNFIVSLVSKLGFSNLALARRRFDFLISRQLFAALPLH